MYGNLIDKISIFVLAIMSLTGCALYKDAQVEPHVRETRELQRLSEEQVNPVEEMLEKERDRRRSRNLR